MEILKIIFAGTSHFSAQHLLSLLNLSYNVVSIITQPDRPCGRGQKIIFSPIKLLSIKYNIPLLQPSNLHEEQFQKKISQLHANIMIVVAYGRIIPKNILTMFSKGCINVHASLLPRWRGATPIQSSILNGDKETGISIIYMDEKLDHGDIIHSRKCDISPTDTTFSLSEKLKKIGICTLLEALKKIQYNNVIKRKQNEENATTSKKIFKQDALLNWKLEAKQLERLIRAFNPWPICYFIVQKNIIKVWKASVIKHTLANVSIGEIVSFNKQGIQINTSHKILNIEKIQFPGKNIIDIQKILKSKKTWFKLGTII
ncbi:MAG: methionyl-tRNA formyltransferase [Buchnera aphidicola (Pentalonia nigronervosa)]|uniref:Methionyl-tRNA formyltransferase n=1 Tax=Buchnera aphidicola (Pentalonia nigronervosa) TaxID=1309793 RepID=A0A7H1AYW8_9GAMM|nr:MAG: methionyl-tRNA formyltransferase [Buchnera aphidicola (Pentalonia nigronervosa)]